MQFEDLRLDESLLRAVRAAGYRTPTPIQAKAIPVILDGRDVLGCAQTGTGKTAAFALPLIQRLGESDAKGADATKNNGTSAGEPASDLSRPNNQRRGRNRAPHRPTSSRRIRAAVICPTRELAQQILESFKTYGAHSGIRATAIFGGVNQHSQVRALVAGVDVIVATPGRLLDLMQQGYVNLAHVETLVLDESDHMLDMGFLPDIRRILGQMPKQRQSLLFSATMPPPIRKLANDMLRNPVPIQVARVSSPAETVSHRVYHVERPQKVSLLVHLLDDQPGSRTLIFTRTKRGADVLARHLGKAGIDAAAIHGNKSQAARNRALAEFRSARTPVLVATDLAARGIDVDDIGRVINYDLTADPETYIHRIGRTGRAGAKGAAISFCTSAERKLLRDIERLIRTQLQQSPVPSSLPQPPKEEPRPPRQLRRPRPDASSAPRSSGSSGRSRRNRSSNFNSNPGKKPARPPKRHRKGPRADSASSSRVAVAP